MADLTRGGRAVDARSQVLRQRRLEHEIHAIEVSVEKYEINVLEAEDTIARLRETVDATLARAEEKKKELKLLLEGKG